MRSRTYGGPLLVGFACAAAIAAPASASAAVPHTVMPGESLGSVAAANGFSASGLAAFNGLSSESLLTIGQTIQIPASWEIGSSSTSTTAVSTDSTASSTTSVGGHTVVAGESLSSIASANGISISALADANGRSADSYVYIGEALSIPAATAATTAGTSTASGGLGYVAAPSGEIPLDASAASAFNSMRQESLNDYGQDIYPAGPLSGYRTYDQQNEMYQSYLNGTGPLAAPPGGSAHNYGTAVDLATPEMRGVVDQIGWSYGWGKTEAPDEWWHVNYGG